MSNSVRIEDTNRTGHGRFKDLYVAMLKNAFQQSPICLGDVYLVCVSFSLLV
jgi:hypothetical protein